MKAETYNLESRKQVGARLKRIRNDLLISRHNLAKVIPNISAKTIAKIEIGEEGDYGVDHIGRLCFFYAIERKHLYDFDFSFPSWEVLRENIIAHHRKHHSSAHTVLDEAPDIVDAIEFRILKNSFLATSREVSEIKKHLAEKYQWDFESSSISNALKTLSRRDLITIDRHPDNKNKRIYLKK